MLVGGSSGVLGGVRVETGVINGEPSPEVGLESGEKAAVTASLGARERVMMDLAQIA